MKKTAFVYDKWLNQLGGGEVVACKIATTLRDLGYNTTFICGKLVDQQKIKTRLSIDLSGIKFIQNFNDDLKLLEITKDADIFFNCTFWDFSISQAKSNFYYTFFPVSRNSWYVKTLVYEFLLKFSKPIEYFDLRNIVFYYLNPHKTVTISFQAILPEFSKSNLQKLNFELQNGKILNQKILIDHFNNLIKYNLKVIPETSSIYIKTNFDLTPTSTSKFRSGVYPKLQSRINKYSSILSTSNYTAQWIEKFWQRQSTTLFPPVKLLKPSEKAKQNIIFTVGRFFTDGHNKKQEIMILAFKKLYDSGYKNWQLHLAGGLDSAIKNQDYVQKLQKLAENYPIIFHFNKPKDFIDKLYLKSKIYWHAAGFGNNKQTSPISFEHFGISPIEAISANCIPVLFNGGGLIEIIRLLNLDPKTHLFNSIDELATNTKNIIDNKIQLPKVVFSKLETLFSEQTFKKNFIKLISK